MSRKRKRSNAGGDAWARARQVCGLSQRQVEMAQRLGMNPEKLPGLRPSPSQKWKLSVGEFIEKRHEKRFGVPPEPWEIAWEMRERPSPREQVDALLAYAIRLHDDLAAWLAHDEPDEALVHEVAADLQLVAYRLADGERPSTAPSIGLPEGAPANDTLPEFDASDLTDDDVPF